MQKRQLEENVKLRGDGLGWHTFLDHILARGCLNSNSKDIIKKSLFFVAKNE
jgi:hypothetical protein